MKICDFKRVSLLLRVSPRFPGLALYIEERLRIRVLQAKDLLVEPPKGPGEVQHRCMLGDEEQG